jgi:hypothetical protein
MQQGTKVPVRSIHILRFRRAIGGSKSRPTTQREKPNIRLHTREIE